MVTIAVLGTGWMGAAIARRLLDTGHRVTVWNRTAGTTALGSVRHLGATIRAAS